MIIRVKGSRLQLLIALIIALKVLDSECYEKTLRKIVRDQSKMVQRPYSDNNHISWANSSPLTQQQFVYPGFAQMKSKIHKMHPKMTTILASVDTGRSKSSLLAQNIAKKFDMHPFELRLARNTFVNASKPQQNHGDHLMFPDFNTLEGQNNSNPVDSSENNIGLVQTSNFFPIVQHKSSHATDQESPASSLPIIISPTSDTKDDRGLLVRSIYNSNTNKSVIDTQAYKPKYSIVEFDAQEEKADFLIGEASIGTPVSNFNITSLYTCTQNNDAEADIDAQEKFSEFNIEPSWMKSKNFWNSIYESRYEYLMRNSNWPPLRVILVPRSDVYTLWKKPFEKLHNNSVRFIISNVVKKLQFYSNLTFSWHEVSHLSQWWKSARQKSRTAVRRLVKEGRLEITTGSWVETDEATSHLFGIVHQLMEGTKEIGHQWLQYNLNYSPDVAWLTTSPNHSPTLAYLLSACGISNLVVTNLHYAWQQYLTEYQYTDFVWIQAWDNDKTTQTVLNEALKKIGKDRFQKHSVFTHFLPFNSAGFRACGPQSDICSEEFNFVHSDNHLDINSFNVKERSERILEQYSKSGTTTTHNVVLAPIGGPFSYELQSEFDLQYNNYKKIADFVNTNQDVYKATIEFGTPKHYFDTVYSSQTSYPTLKGDFLNFADISDGSPAYWTGLFTSRPQIKILVRRLQATLRSTEILLSFALSNNVLQKIDMSTLFARLVNARESLARLQDRNVVSGTLTSAARRYAHTQFVKMAQDCWYIQEVAASLLNSEPHQNTTYLEKYVYREGEFISSFKSIVSGDQIYLFNSLSHERIEVVELVSRYPSIRILDHNKRDVVLQIKPMFKYGFQGVVKISKQFFRLSFVAVIPPLSFQLFKVKETFDTTHSLSTIYCTACENEDGYDTSMSPFTTHPLESGDIQLENYKYRLIFDEYSGFLKSITEKSTNIEKPISIEFGAFKSSNINSGMFLFNTNVSKPLEDILSQYRLNNSKLVMILTGSITTEFILFYGNFLHHVVKIYNLMNSPLSSAIKLETKIDYDISPKHRELEVFMSIQTDVNNGNPPELFIDNNGFQYTARLINVSRRVESNVYPMTTMTFIQDNKNRFTVLTDHAQGVTAFQEGQLIVMFDRRILFDDGRGSNEGLADNTAAWQTHFILLESFATPYNNEKSKISLKLPSFSAIYLANALNYFLDIYFIDNNKSKSSYFAFLPLVRLSFPCDVTVLNYRTVLNRGTPANYVPNIALLTLHRQSFSCAISHDSFIDCNDDSSFSLQKILRNARAIYQTNLVGTTEGVPITIIDKANFKTMEISTFRIHY